VRKGGERLKRETEGKGKKREKQKERKRKEKGRKKIGCHPRKNSGYGFK